MMEFSSVRTLLNDPPNRFNISRKSKSLVITVFLFWFISMPVFIYSERNSYDFEGVRLRIRFLMKRMKTPSISVAVAKDTRILWEESFGWADREKEIKATPHTMYSLASVSKPITATGLMVLAERGLVDLNQPVNAYLGTAKLRAFEGNVLEATVERILHHTAGLPMHWHFFYDGDSYKRPSMDETIKRFGILVSPPGDRFEYSNLGYGIIESVIERISKKTYPEFMKVEVFEALGLSRTAVFTKAPEENSAAQRYVENKAAAPFYDFDHRGASAVYSSAHDLVRFGMFHLKNHLPDQKQILCDSTIDKMQRSVDPKLPDSQYKLGWDVGERNGYKVVSHGGGMTGTRTSLLLVPSENIAVVVLCNGEYMDLSRIYDSILAVMLPSYRKNHNTRQEIKSSGESNKLHSLSQCEGEWAGKIVTYKGSLPVQLYIHKNGNSRLIFSGTSLSENKICEPIKPPRYENGFITADFDGEIPIEETSRCRHKIFLRLKLHENRLSGFAAAVSYREFFCLPFYIELVKK